LGEDEVENVTVTICLVLVLGLLVVIVSATLYRKAVRREKMKQALFEDRFSKNYDKYPYRRSKLH
jgi:hypothetical protein